MMLRLAVPWRGPSAFLARQSFWTTFRPFTNPPDIKGCTPRRILGQVNRKNLRYLPWQQIAPEHMRQHWRGEAIA